MNRICGDRDLTIELGIGARDNVTVRSTWVLTPSEHILVEFHLQPDANVTSSERVTSETSPCDEEDNQNQKACP